MHVGRRTEHVAERGGFESADVFGLVSHEVAAEVGVGAAVAAEAEVVEAVVGEVRAVVAIHAAALGAEEVETAQGGIGEGFAAAFGEAVELVGAGDDAALEGGDGLREAREGDGFVAKGGAKRFAVAGDGGEARDDDGGLGAHLVDVEEHGFDLGLERVGAAVPEVAGLMAGVGEGGGVAFEFRAAVAEGDGAAVAPGEIGIVAGGAGDLAAAGDTRIEEERFAERDFGGGGGIVGGRGRRAERAEFDESDPGIDVGLGPIGGGTRVEDAEFGGEFLIFFGGELRAGFAGGGGGRRGGGGIGLGVDGQEERRGRQDEEGEKGKFHGNEAAMVAGDSAVWRTEFRRVGRE